MFNFILNYFLMEWERKGMGMGINKVLRNEKVYFIVFWIDLK